MNALSPNPIDELAAQSSRRYLLAGVLVTIALAIICVGAALLLSTGLNFSRQPAASPLPQPQLERPTTAEAGRAFTVRGRGFQPGESVELFLAPSPAAAFRDLISLGSTIARSDGTIELSANAPIQSGTYYLIARGSSSGFTPFAELSTSPAVGSGISSAELGAKPLLPELHILAVSIGPQQDVTCLSSSAPLELGLRVTIQNRGAVLAPPFVVQANDRQVLLPNGLDPGASTTLWFPGYSTGNNRVVIDPSNALPKAPTSSLVFEGQLTVPTPLPLCTPTTLPPLGYEEPTSAPNAAGVWFGQFFPNQDLLGNPQFATTRKELNFNWGSNSPGGSIPRNDWSAIFVRNENFPTTDNYLFTLVVDGGARVYVDGKLLIDEWRFGGLRTANANSPLTAGPHNLRVEYFKATATARLSLSWRVNYSGWIGRYYNSTNRDGPLALKRDDAEINFNWGLGSPAPEVNNDLFSVSWQRQLSLPAGEYLFQFDLTDGMRFYLDNQLVIDSYNIQGARVLTATRQLDSGRHFFEVQYAHYFGPARVRFTFTLLPPTPTPTVPTPTPSPTVPTPTPTPTVPTPTPTATPTATPEAPTATPTVTPSPTSDATLTVIIGP
ncbi:MAG: PA14 domain-containing protein [Thermoflexales bacterium]